MSQRPIKVGRAVRFAIFELALFMLGMLFVRREIWQLHATTFTINFWQEGLLIPLSALDGAITGGFSSRARNVQNTPAYKGLLLWATPLFFFLYVGCSALCERLIVGVFPTAVHEPVRTIGLGIVLAGMFVRLWSQFSAPSQLQPSRSEAATRPHDGEPKPSAEPTRTESTTPTEPTPAPDSTPLTGEAPTRGPDDEPKSTVESTPTTPTTPTETAPPISSPPDNIDSAQIFPLGPHKILRHPDASGQLLSLCGLPLVFNAWLPLMALPGIIILLKWHISDQEAFRISQLGDPYLEYRKKTWNLIPYVY